MIEVFTKVRNGTARYNEDLDEIEYEVEPTCIDCHKLLGCLGEKKS
jgi:hypothetical protein